ncbi:uncharacterized protein LOC129227905 [Uloborus diversus]|uniref:uncharacterized protein LOC129227905 n=1 Tax=Uloborus diversus TaxID=327109 RepID=UPI002408FB22|nr:uncharacterized protein LOC129227905 [Uloborus diversus]
MSKAVRLQEHSESRKSSRSELVNLRRNIDHNDVDDSLLPESEPLNEKAVTATTVSKPLSRLEQLKKWKEEKALKKKIENENRQKAPFVVGKAKPEMGCSKVPLRSLQNSSTMFGAKNSSRFISKSVSSVSTARSTAGVTGKVNVPASTSGAKPPTKNVYLPASSGMKPPTKTGAASSTNQKAKPPSALPALSAAVRDKSQMKTNIPKTCASRLPTRNLPQGNQNLKMLESRIPACKPAMQQKKDVKEKKPIGKIDGKSNPPDRIGKISGKANCLAPPVFKSEKRDCGLKFPKPLPVSVEQ